MGKGKIMIINQTKDNLGTLIKAERSGVDQRIFCSSLMHADWFSS